MLLGAFLAGVFLYALPSPNSEVSFKLCYASLVSPLQEYVRALSLSHRAARSSCPSRFQIFAPIFFASIGTSIPFVALWTGRIIWRGVVYAILMTLGKLLVGLVVLLADCGTFSESPSPSLEEPNPEGAVDFSTRPEKVSYGNPPPPTTPSKFHLCLLTTTTFPPAIFLGTALVARGEIGVGPPLLSSSHSRSRTRNADPHPPSRVQLPRRRPRRRAVPGGRLGRRSLHHRWTDLVLGAHQEVRTERGGGSLGSEEGCAGGRVSVRWCVFLRPFGWREDLIAGLRRFLPGSSSSILKRTLAQTRATLPSRRGSKAPPLSSFALETNFPKLQALAVLLGDVEHGRRSELEQSNWSWILRQRLDFHLSFAAAFVSTLLTPASASGLRFVCLCSCPRLLRGPEGQGVHTVSLARPPPLFPIVR